MKAKQSVFKTRREYNRWAGNQTLEDFALRFTAKSARKLSISAVGQTALGATAFLALEALSAAATLQYGFINTLYAMLAVAAAILLTGIPITYYAARNGLDIDLLTRGAGFGYLGSTVTSLVYASFTFIFFAIEAAILASALKAIFNIPLAVGYVICVVIVIPIVTHGIRAISRFQLGTQPLWLALQCTALITVVYFEADKVPQWTNYTPESIPSGSGFNLALFGACSSLFFALIAQIGEQVDYLRFLPTKTKKNRIRWWFWMLFSGPGWISVGLLKMLLGSFLAYLAVRQLIPFEQATDPVYMYQMTFSYLTESPTIALMLAGVMVIISQMKINVTNAYAGSIAWSNFFSRLTHNHLGRVVWLIFNMAIALTLMELGAYRALEAIIGVFALVAISWLGCLSANFVINIPLKLSPKHIEFKRSHLYDINPVGFVSMLIAVVLGLVAYMGYFGESARHLAHYISLASCYILVPFMALLTKSKYYLARTEQLVNDAIEGAEQLPYKIVHRCTVCENEFEQEDMSHCPAYQGVICSLCCSLDARCLDMCKTDSRFGDQFSLWMNKLTRGAITDIITSRVFRFLCLFLGITIINATLLSVIYFHTPDSGEASRELLFNTFWTLFMVLSIIFGVLSWLTLLAHESRTIAQQESNHQTQLLIEEIEAHKETDTELQDAKEAAEKANNAKSRYLSGISHELRTPLQSVLGYAQLLEKNPETPPQHQRQLSIIRNSGEHLANLIEGLLEISKIEAGRLDIYYEEVKINEVLKQIVQIFQPQAESKGVEFNFHLHQPLPYKVKSDEKRIKQILINLISNAIKYTIEGRVDFHVHYRNQVATFIISDTGVGISSKDIKRILNPFERVRDPKVSNVPGTGLGLTIVRLLTDVLGGNLEVKSTYAQGSCFSVELMLSSVDKPVAKVPDKKPIIGYHGKRKTVLIVDDEAVHRGLLSDLLSPLGFTIAETQNASECLSQLDTISPDMMILDVNMPGMNGLELSKMIREIGQRQPILMLSADATESHKITEQDIKPYNAYMTKPIRNRELVERIGELLDLKWLLASDNIDQAEPETVTKDNSVIILAPSPQIDELLEAAQVGHKRGVMNILAQLENENQFDSTSIEQLRSLAEAMRFDKIERLIEESSNQ